MLNNSQNDSSNPATFSAVGLAGVAFESLLMIVICFGNGLIFVAFKKNEHLRTLTNYYILQVAVADFCVGLLMPMHIAMYMRPQMLQNIKLCMFRYTSMMFFMSVSMLALTAMTYDRFMAVTSPFTYHETMSTKQYVRAALFVWLFPFITGFVFPMIWHNDYEDIPEGVFKQCDFMYMMLYELIAYLMLPLFVVITCAILGMYTKIFYVAARHARAIAENDRQAPGNGNKRMRKDMKMVKTGMIVLGGFYLCWLPFNIMCAIQSYGRMEYVVTLRNIRSLSLFPAVTNSALNPIIYAFRMEKFKREFMKVLGCKISDKNKDISTGSNDTQITVHA